jgi:hypothetical protein
MRNEVMMDSSRTFCWIVTAVLMLTGVSCATNSTGNQDFSAFLSQIARECKPLIIGSDDYSQAIVFNGLGADPDNYNNFLIKTQALYRGGIPPDIYRSSLTAFIGAGTYNDRSFKCIIAHLPTQPKQP